MRGDAMLFLSAMMRNCVSIICFTILAIHFDKWWIALFSALFVCGASTTTEGGDVEDERRT